MAFGAEMRTVMMVTIESTVDYELALLRIAQLKAMPIVDAPEAAELVALMAAVEEWEAECDPSPLARAKPGDFA